MVTKKDLNKDNINRHAKAEAEKLNRVLFLDKEPHEQPWSEEGRIVSLPPGWR